ncbi:MAG: NAD(P)H-dependent flavin oxidoreductase [Pseudodesulfovibrio sp.]|jgi:NAD(P)H-dependent flavin oxidoreductase YrpB (nitropropane dioxygenase family)|uniref:2-nitropropane dioxygenase n=1 Tax=Pseudodesulfovibrio indicus TaxID=1716143 RepID=A0A126QRB8_9BACT|nr:nitronate monooxygenase family protein [Pseudodesulfovibrio indicus]AMK12015.1 2-nitropropane dioxygenase [Pseudodesulfovibrio indicus]TDT88613.1 NAD(P)H-dependent flavin oxidoreductase YrpB (nitropropane dioxygenase family) [Pseudodesulfovibrio indicus]
MKLPSLNFGDLTARLPIIQGGMGVGISLSGLASAVANEGGVGVIATSMIGMRDPQRARDPEGADRRGLIEEIRKARAKMTDGLLGVNIMCALTNYGDMVRTSIREKVDLIISGAGLPLDLPGYLREMSDEMKEEVRTKLVPIVSSGRAASILCRKWAGKFGYLPDGFVVEGPKAGGHLGFKAEQIEDPEYQLEKILAEVVEAVAPYREKHEKPIPVIAAGGVYTGEDIARFLEMGASGVQMGTRFVATKECDADEAFKQAYVNARQEDVTIIKSPVGMPGRALKNTFLDAVTAGLKHPKKCVHKCLHSCAEDKSPYCIAQALVNAYKGKLKNGFAFCGANAYLVDKIITVKELMATLSEEAERKYQEVGQKLQETKEEAERRIKEVLNK